jgi:hypothetical protein
VWSPGYYRIENYADKVEVSAHTPDGKALTAEVAEEPLAVSTGGAALSSSPIACSATSGR